MYWLNGYPNSQDLEKILPGAMINIVTVCSKQPVF